MKILLILPPSRFNLKNEIGIAAIPLGLGYLASTLEKDNHEVKIIDAPTLNYGMSEIKKEIQEFEPEVVGITATTSSVYDAYHVAELAKKIRPQIITVIGGPHVTFTAEETLKECPFIDLVVRREGEITLKKLVNFWEAGSPNTGSLAEIKGITFRENGKIKKTGPRPFIENLDDLPFPAYHLFPIERYKLENHRFANIITSRGCPFSCIFCSSSELCGKRWRARSPENVVEEIKLLKDKFDVNEIEFLDDTFTLNQKRAKRISDLLVKENLNISWACSSRVDTLSRELIEKLKRAGCHTIYLGIESGSQKVLNIVQKGITLVQAERAIRIVKKAHLNTLGSFIIGIPGESAKTIKKTIDFAKRLSPTFAQFTICTPYPGTKLFRIAKEKGWLLTKDWSRYTILDPVMKIPGLVSKKLIKWLMKAYLSFYLRPKFILDQLVRGNFFVIKKAFKAALSYQLSKHRDNNSYLGVELFR